MTSPGEELSGSAPDLPLAPLSSAEPFYPFLGMMPMSLTRAADPPLPPLPLAAALEIFWGLDPIRDDL